MRLPLLALAALSLATPAFPQFGPLEALHDPGDPVVAELVDVDLDGALDLVTIEAQPGDQLDVYWHAAGAPSPFGSPQFVGTAPGTVDALPRDFRRIDGGDLDGDGHVELLVTSSHGLFLFDGLPTNTFAPAQLVDTVPASSVEVLDVDGDGDLDIARGVRGAAAAAGPRLFLNDGVGALTAFDLPNVCCTNGLPLFGDIDLDGDLDIILHSGELEPYLYVENQGGVAFLPPVTIAAVATNFISLGDADGDGDLDILQASFFFGTGGWIENVGGVFSITRDVFGSTVTTSAPRAGDIDGDGVPDLVLIQDCNQSLWARGDGAGGFLAPELVDIDRDAIIVDLVDIDADGALDIVCGRSLNQGIAAYRNVTELGAAVCAANANSTGRVASLRASGSRSVATNGLVVTVAEAPPGQFAALLVGQVFQTSVPAGSAGVLCLGAPFALFRGPGEIRPIDPSGTFRLTVDLSAIPSATGSQVAQVGQTWLFQGVFRDPSPQGASNLSPAVAVTFVP